MINVDDATKVSPNMTGPVTLFLTFLRLGLTSFGGPTAHFGYFRREFVDRRQWLDAAGFADLLSLCQFLPGPSSSQLGFAIGLQRGGMLGGFLAWLGFTLPSALIMAWCGVALQGGGTLLSPRILHGLQLLSVAVVADAVWSLGRQLAADRWRFSLLILAAIAALAWPNAGTQAAVMALAALAGRFLPPAPPLGDLAPAAVTLPLWVAPLAGALLAGGLLLLPLLVAPLGGVGFLLDRFFRAGALVFGGGHVVLPLLQDALVPSGWIPEDRFLAGYALAQAVPGPLFTFAAFLGAAGDGQPHGWVGAAWSLAAIFLPSLLLLLAVLPVWQTIRRAAPLRAALSGVNASVVGLLLAAFYQPIFTSSVLGRRDAVFAALLFLLVSTWRLPAWLLLGLTVLVSAL